MCKRDKESNDHLFFHCPAASTLRWRVLDFAKVYGVVPSCVQFCFEFMGIGYNMKAQVLWRCVICVAL